MRDPDFTLSAGPVTAWPRVLAALGSPLVYHYDPVFLEAFRRTERKLAQIFLTKNDVLLMQGEAVLGLAAFVARTAGVGPCCRLEDAIIGHERHQGVDVVAIPCVGKRLQDFRCHFGHCIRHDLFCPPITDWHGR